MAGHFQTTFSIAGPDVGGMALLEEVGSAVRRLTSELAHAPELVDASDGEWESEKGKVRLNGGNSGEAGYSRLSWILPNGWEMRCRIATQGADVELETDVYGPGAGDDLARAPRMLAELIDHFECYFQGQRLTTTVTSISEENAGAFAPGTLYDPSRRLPIVVVSELSDGVTLVDSQELQSRLLGLAQVVTYGAEIAATINKDLGRHVCSGGAVRLYTPGFKRTDEPGQHRLWSPARVRVLQLSLWREVRDACMASALLEVGSRMYEEVSEQVRKAETEEFFRKREEEAAEAEREDAEAERQVQQLLTEKTRQLGQTLSETKQKLTTAEAETYKLRDENTSMQATIDGLLDDVNRPSPVNELRRQNQEALAKADDRRQQELKAVEEENNRLRAETREKGLRNDDLNARIRELEFAHEPTVQSKRDRRLNTQLAEARSSLRNMEEQIDGMRVEGFRKDQRIDYLVKQNNELAERNARWESQPNTEERLLGNVDEEPDDHYVETNDLQLHKSVSDVVLNAQSMPGLRFLKSAHESAEKSPYRHLHLLTPALKAISECGVERAKGSLGMTVENWFAQQEVDYKPHESASTNKRHPRIERDDTCDMDLNMEEHIALGGGSNRDPKDVLRIHMAWCEKEKLWLIGHVGQHLDVASS